MKRLGDKIAVVTGSSGGIGAALAVAYAAEGAQVVVTYKGNEKGGRDVARATGAELCLPLDVCDRRSVDALMEKVARHHGRIDVLVNNAGINVTGDFDQITDEQWDAVVDTDLKGVFHCCQAALPHLSDRGRVINIGSLSGEYGGPRTPSYAAAKAGVMALTHCLARFVGARGITVNCVSPGTIGSEMLERTMPADLKDKLLPNVLLGRLGTVQEVAETVLFLASPGASYVTGQTLGVNGGLWV
jgi:3-oxoacyl-[acyl-carrier protein] reductase